MPSTRQVVNNGEIEMKLTEDDIMNEVKLHRLEQEIKQLKYTAELIQPEIIKLQEKLEKIKELTKKVTDNPKEHPCNAWFIHELKQILDSQEKE